VPLLRPWSRLWPTGPGAQETLYLTAADGVRLALHRVRPPSGKGAPVMLLHGLGANGFGWLLPRRSFAHWLASRGFDVFVPELRGAGHSAHNGFTWNLDDYLQYDLPAFLAAIREESGQREVRWVGHSMGGILLCCYAQREQDPDIVRGVALGSALDYSAGDSGFARLLPLRPVLERLSRIPFGHAAHLLSPLLGRVNTPLEAFNFSPRNVEPEVVREVHAQAFEWIPISLLLSLATTFEPDGLRSADGVHRYRDCASRCTVPLLLVAGSADVQCPVAAVEDTARRIGPTAQVRAFGRAYGSAEDYGHFDLLVGKNAPREVWPHLAAWLEDA
jgi:pimeloyl-ACP methyl ester carboxylesterase